MMPLAYLVGSVNTSIILMRVLKRGDPRVFFSGNAGTSNVTRILGKKWGAIVLIFDMAKAALIAWFGNLSMPPDLIPFLCFFLLLGNCFPVFHGFKGGKGVGHFLGFAAFVSPFFTMLSAIAWVAVYFGVARVTFIPSFVMTALLGLGLAQGSGYGMLAWLGSGLTVTLIFLVHRKNVVQYLSDRRKTGPEAAIAVHFKENHE